MLQDKVETIGGCELFDGLEEGSIRRLAEIALTKRYRRGEVIFLQDQPADAFYVVQSGSVKIHRISARGKEHILETFGRFEVFGAVAALDGKPYPATAVAVGPTVALRLEMTDLRALLGRHPRLSTAVIATLCERLRHVSALAADLTLKEVDSRLAQYLFDLAARQGCRVVGPFAVTLPTTKTHLAAHLGIANETLSRTLAKMTAAGLIMVSGRTIRVRRPEKLEKVRRQAPEKKRRKR